MRLQPVGDRRITRFGPVVSALAIVVAVVLSLVTVSVASAKTGVAASRFESPPGGFGVPVGVGVDDSLSLSRGSVYVSDLTAGEVDVFSASGVPESTVAVPGVGPFELSVDDYPGLGEGDVYVAGLSAGVVLRFTPGLASETEAIKGLAEPKDAVVDAAGDIFVVENAGNEGAGKVLEFNQAGEPVDPAGTVSASNTVAENLNAPQSLAVNVLGTELYVATNGGGTLKYTLSGGAYVPASEPFDPAGSLGVSFGGAGDIFIGQSRDVAQYEPNGTLLSTFAEGVLAGGFGVSVNSESGDVYVADAAGGTVFLLEPGPLPEEPTAQPATLKGAEATLNGTLNGGGSEYHFAYNAGASCQGGPTTTVGSAASGAVSAQITGLLALTQYTFCLVATDKYGSSTSPGVEFTTSSVPVTVEGETASEVSARSARLSGTVNINNNTGGGYYYEYGTPAAFQAGEEQKTTETSLPQSSSPAPTSVQIAGLAANTEYRFQLIAKNTSGEITPGAPTTFNTLPAGSTTLPDHRVYEMVTPPGNQNADVYVPRALPGHESFSEGIDTQTLFQVATDGSAIAYIADPTTGGYGQGGAGAGNQYLAKHSPMGGWINHTIQVPASLAASYYQGFSNNLSVGILNAGSPGEPGLPALSPEAPGNGYSVLYSCADSERQCETPAEGASKPENLYHPVYGRPQNRTPVEFGTHNVFNVGRNEEYVAVFAGGSADFSDLLFEANDALLPGEGPLERELRENVKTEVVAREDHNYLYDSVEGRLELVDVLPDGKVAGDATFGALPVGEARHNPPGFSGVVSGDGSRVYWTALSGAGTEGQVYMREDGTVTVPVSAGVARYWSSAEDGRYAFYTEAGGLYRFNAVTDAREVLIAPSADVVGVLGSSEDGSYVYFAADGTITAGSSIQTCEKGNGFGEGGTLCNLYVWHDGVTRLVAVLSALDGYEVAPLIGTHINNALFGDWQPGLGQRTAEVGAGGDLVFMSDRSLGVVGFPHGYPNNGLDEVYTYDAGSGQLFCVSCSSSGEAPPAGEVGAAAFLPVSWDDTYHAQWMSEGGDRVFFDSAVPLVPQDTNGKQDVYEWEREGTGSCTAGSGANGGCVYLLSGGTSRQDSWLIGASASGDDAFIVTRAQLVPQDRNEAFDLYDARVGGVEPVGEPACTGTDCQGTPAAAPTFATPPSVTYNGVGNFPAPTPSLPKVKTKAKPLTRAQKLANALKACRKQPKKKRAVCEAQMRKRYEGSLHKSSGGKK